ncbi:phytoene/squalene synthase family protein [Actinokineospora sp. NBRC 105648]|uniref:phytoene/squalene synthase family protein n=1 Tax=Actinokineospora sp. NBRC 105648 TaxID=3032206 RepID=UPI0024A49F70|nr:phytoene/squalene synthase family protein [Actinokineospora sp. NBRC 105648]GLZ38612.1 phytoene synthase [Actinokineospora sp. NBRC 105648]
MGRVQALTGPLSTAYATSRRINARYGRTYYLATRLLPPERRPAVHALYGFARVADEIVDEPGENPTAELADLESALKTALDGAATTDPILLALSDTVHRYAIEPALFADFLRSMRMDLTVTSYANAEELSHYTYGSASVIGLMLLPVLGTVAPAEEAAPYAAALGEAFQLTNFLRDVGEDLDRGRIYLPADHLAAFGVDRDRLTWAREHGPDKPVRRAVAHFAAHARSVYRAAEPGTALLDPVARPCVATAARLYAAILDEIAAADHDVLTRRAVVPTGRRLAIALPGAARCVLARLRTRGPARGA